MYLALFGKHVTMAIMAFMNIHSQHQHETWPNKCCMCFVLCRHTKGCECQHPNSVQTVLSSPAMLTTVMLTTGMRAHGLHCQWNRIGLAYLQGVFGAKAAACMLTPKQGKVQRGPCSRGPPTGPPLLVCRYQGRETSGNRKAQQQQQTPCALAPSLTSSSPSYPKTQRPLRAGCTDPPASTPCPWTMTPTRITARRSDGGSSMQLARLAGVSLCRLWLRSWKAPQKRYNPLPPPFPDVASCLRWSRVVFVLGPIQPWGFGRLVCYVQFVAQAGWCCC